MDDNILARAPVTRRDLVDALQTLGIRPGGVVMAHCRLSSFGYLVGGLETVVRALLEVLGPEGTLMTLTGWEHDSYDLDERPGAARSAYLEDPPVFDPQVSEAARDFGRLAERIRTWPGALRSNHPEASFAAVGARADWLMSDQPWDHPYAAGSPLAKLVEAKGDVVMLGAPLETITLLHYAEEMSDVADKKLVTYKALVRRHGSVEWQEINDIDTTIGAFPYEKVVSGNTDAFEVIGKEAFGSGIGRRHSLGDADLHIFPAPELVEFAIRWMERHFG